MPPINESIDPEFNRRPPSQLSRRPRRCPSCGQMIGVGVQKPLSDNREVVPVPGPIGGVRPSVRPIPRPIGELARSPELSIDPGILSGRRQRDIGFYQGPSAKERRSGTRWGTPRNNSEEARRKLLEEMKKRQARQNRQVTGQPVSRRKLV